MKITDDTEVTFDWNGQEYTAYGNPDIETCIEDIGPVRYHEHYRCEVVDNVTMLNIEIQLNGEVVKDPPKELLEKADDFLCCKAEEDFDAGR
jgi:hypothetical protein